MPKRSLTFCGVCYTLNQGYTFIFEIPKSILLELKKREEKQ